jgi:quercetin dioxygenase-like cupin family protein
VIPLPREVEHQEAEMSQGAATRTKVLAIGVGALLAPLLLPGAASADPDHQTREGAPDVPAAAAGTLSTTPPVRATADGLRIGGGDSVVRLRTTEGTDVVLVTATLTPGASTGWHEHVEDSLIILKEGTLRVVAPHGGRHAGCSEEIVQAGTAFAHDAEAHAFVNDGSGNAVFDIVYFVPKGGSPAPQPVGAPPGC